MTTNRDPIDELAVKEAQVKALCKALRGFIGMEFMFPISGGRAIKVEVPRPIAKDDFEQFLLFVQTCKLGWMTCAEDALKEAAASGGEVRE